MSAGASTASSGTQQTSRITSAIMERYAPLGSVRGAVGQPGGRNRNHVGCAVAQRRRSRHILHPAAPVSLLGQRHQRNRQPHHGFDGHRRPARGRAGTALGGRCTDPRVRWQVHRSPGLPTLRLWGRVVPVVRAPRSVVAHRIRVRCGAGLAATLRTVRLRHRDRSGQHRDLAHGGSAGELPV